MKKDEGPRRLIGVSPPRSSQPEAIFCAAMIDGFKPRGAVAIQLHTGHRLSPARHHHSRFCDASSLFPDWSDATHDNVVSLRGVEVVSALHRPEQAGE
jgi:hypothetical protein